MIATLHTANPMVRTSRPAHGAPGPWGPPRGDPRAAAATRCRLTALLAATCTLLVCLALPAPADTVARRSPEAAAALVHDTAQQLLSLLQKRRAEIKARPQRLYALVEHVVVPQFDFERITRSAVGRYWHQAKPEQRHTLVTAFQRLLVRTYATALLNYSGQKLEMLPPRAGGRKGEVVVRTEVNDPANGKKVPVDYRMAWENNVWKAYDVVIDGVSLVANYRHSFAEQISRGGIAGLIRSIQTRNRQRQS